MTAHAVQQLHRQQWHNTCLSPAYNHPQLCSLKAMLQITQKSSQQPHKHTDITVLRPSWILSGTTWVSWHQKCKTRKVKPVWIYRSKRQWVAVASVGPYANLHLDPDMQPCQHPTTQFFTGRMPFLPPNQQRQSTEGSSTEGSYC